MSSRVIEINSDEQFHSEVPKHASKLVVVDFFANWCGPCRSISPFVNQLSIKYPDVVFIKVNSDKCKEISTALGVRGLPTFHFYISRKKVDELVGADPQKLEAKVVKHSAANSSSSSTTTSSPVPGYTLLNDNIVGNQIECLNEMSKHTFKSLLDKSGYLESDCDEQLIIYVPFRELVKLHSLQFKAPSDGRAPKTIKIFVNRTSTPDFDEADSAPAVQEIVLSKEEAESEKVVNLKFVKFQNVSNVALFIKDNQGGKDTTVITGLSFIGSQANAPDVDGFRQAAQDVLSHSHNH